MQIIVSYFKKRVSQQGIRYKAKEWNESYQATKNNCVLNGVNAGVNA